MKFARALVRSHETAPAVGGCGGGGCVQATGGLAARGIPLSVVAVVSVVFVLVVVLVVLVVAKLLIKGELVQRQ